MSPELLTAGIVLLATVDQVMDDLDRWRADRKDREARESLATCEAIWQLPTIPQQRKETGQ